MAGPCTDTLSPNKTSQSVTDLKITRVANGWELVIRPYKESLGYGYDPKDIYIFSTVFEMTNWMLKNL